MKENGTGCPQQPARAEGRGDNGADCVYMGFRDTPMRAILPG